MFNISKYLPFIKKTKININFNDLALKKQLEMILIINENQEKFS
jgi:hypothetical protein